MTYNTVIQLIATNFNWFAYYNSAKGKNRYLSSFCSNINYHNTPWFSNIQAGTSSQENVIYVVEDFNNPVPKPFISRSGQYDGLAIKNGWLYFSDWNNGTIGKINLGKPDQIITLNTDFTMQGPAQISFFDDYLCIPDLVGSKIFMLLDWLIL